MAIKSINGTNVYPDNIRIHSDAVTGECGLQIKMTNATGDNTVKGYLCTVDTSATNAFISTPINRPDIIGIVYEANVANGQEAWVWIQGKVQIYFNGNVTRGQFARSTATGDADTTAGFAQAENAPSSPFATDKHFQEIGHCVESRTGAGLALTIIHFN
jgi:hypothetical protein